MCVFSNCCLNPTTVTRIYADLSADDVIVLKQGQGAFVSRQLAAADRIQSRKHVGELIRRMLAEAVRAGLSQTDIQKLIDAEMNKLPEETA